MQLVEVKSDVELKHCPFCGGKATLYREEDGGFYKVKCDNFDCWIGPETSFYSNQTIAIEAWQERAELANCGAKMDGDAHEPR